MVFEKIQAEDFEQVIYFNDPQVGLKAIVSIHSTTLGPATGGCRMWNYSNEQDALIDVLRLSKGMTYKAAISGLNWGGGKSVIIGDPKKIKTPALLERFGEFVNRLNGQYITAKDVGISGEDLRIIKHKTSHILGIEGEAGSSGDPSPATAWGVFHGMRASAKHAFKANHLKGLTVALQGLGSVSYYLLEHLIAEGAKVIGCDIDSAMIDRAIKRYGIEIVRPESIYDVPCDIFAPSALGAAINAETLPRLKTKIVAGPANNQLATPEMGEELRKRGILYAPDYAINAGGLINIYHEGMTAGGYLRTRAFDHVARIGKTMTEIFERSDHENIPTHLVADRMAEERFKRPRLGT